MRNNNFIINSLSIYHLLQIILMLSHMKGARDKRKTIRDETRDKKQETRYKNTFKESTENDVNRLFMLRT